MTLDWHPCIRTCGYWRDTSMLQQTCEAMECNLEQNKAACIDCVKSVVAVVCRVVVESMHTQHIACKPVQETASLSDGQSVAMRAHKLGVLVDRTWRKLSDAEVQKIADTYHAWRGDKGAGEYADVAGFCKSASMEDIGKHGDVLTPGRYVGAAEQEEDGEPFEAKMRRLSAQWREQRATAAQLDAVIEANLKELGYGQ